ncbi:uncharacterized protein LOC133421977 isoform X3 [Cololabis saira]|uniref:uncharacterized protein LOC133421977 isoform X3 n=1 Tax=Cololabis saira TaxID=129043 RepID=UPI002AD27387|nr:uncharacterized protein LOC133421977 isoform X3 [Cololabis saira]
MAWSRGSAGAYPSYPQARGFDYPLDRSPDHHRDPYTGSRGSAGAYPSYPQARGFDYTLDRSPDHHRDPYTGSRGSAGAYPSYPQARGFDYPLDRSPDHHRDPYTGSRGSAGAYPSYPQARGFDYPLDRSPDHHRDPYTGSRGSAGAYPSYPQARGFDYPLDRSPDHHRDPYTGSRGSAGAYPSYPQARGFDYPLDRSPDHHRDPYTDLPVRSSPAAPITDKNQREVQAGDLIRISRDGSRHWAVYVGDGDVVHLQKAGTWASKGKVLKEKLLLKWNKWKVKNPLDDKYTPRPVYVIVEHACSMVDTELKYSKVTYNSEHFAHDMRYGWSGKRQVKAAGARGNAVQKFAGKGLGIVKVAAAVGGPGAAAAVVAVGGPIALVVGGAVLGVKAAFKQCRKSKNKKELLAHQK